MTTEEGWYVPQKVRITKIPHKISGILLHPLREDDYSQSQRRVYNET